MDSCGPRRIIQRLCHPGGNALRATVRHCLPSAVEKATHHYMHRTHSNLPQRALHTYVRLSLSPDNVGWWFCSETVREITPLLHHSGSLQCDGRHRQPPTKRATLNAPVGPGVQLWRNTEFSWSMILRLGDVFFAQRWSNSGMTLRSSGNHQMAGKLSSTLRHCIRT